MLLICILCCDARPGYSGKHSVFVSITNIIFIFVQLFLSDRRRFYFEKAVRLSRDILPFFWINLIARFQRRNNS